MSKSTRRLKVWFIWLDVISVSHPVIPLNYRVLLRYKECCQLTFNHLYFHKFSLIISELCNCRAAETSGGPVGFIGSPTETCWSLETNLCRTATLFVSDRVWISQIVNLWWMWGRTTARGGDEDNLSARPSLQVDKSLFDFISCTHLHSDRHTALSSTLP